MNHMMKISTERGYLFMTATEHENAGDVYVHFVDIDLDFVVNVDCATTPARKRLEKENILEKPERSLYIFGSDTRRRSQCRTPCR